ncbi:MAG: hypothetical protein KY476_08330 [Planctomycetes bacterium]|nr:hypothetical protein [Planctomycetota bacterium]
MNRKSAIQTAMRVAELLGGLFFAYIFMLGVERLYELNPTIKRASQRVVIVVVPVAIVALLLFYGIQAVRAFRQGMLEARKRNPTRTGPPRSTAGP